MSIVAGSGIKAPDVVAGETPPVGTTYIQLPISQSLSPAGMGWQGTWHYLGDGTLPSYGGAFFRTEGGNALAFNGGLQADSLGPHSHTYSLNTGGMSANAAHSHYQYTGQLDDSNFSNSEGQYPPGAGTNAYDNGLVTSTTNIDHTQAEPTRTTIMDLVER